MDSVTLNLFTVYLECSDERLLSMLNIFWDSCVNLKPNLKVTLIRFKKWEHVFTPKYYGVRSLSSFGKKKPLTGPSSDPLYNL